MKRGVKNIGGPWHIGLQEGTDVWHDCPRKFMFSYMCDICELFPHDMKVRDTAHLDPARHQELSPPSREKDEGRFLRMHTHTSSRIRMRHHIRTR
jgi:hypothetical protein